MLPLTVTLQVAHSRVRVGAGFSFALLWQYTALTISERVEIMIELFAACILGGLWAVAAVAMGSTFVRD